MVYVTAIAKAVCTTQRLTAFPEGIAITYSLSGNADLAQPVEVAW